MIAPSVKTVVIEYSCPLFLLKKKNKGEGEGEGEGLSYEVGCVLKKSLQQSSSNIANF